MFGLSYLKNIYIPVQRMGQYVMQDETLKLGNREQWTGPFFTKHFLDNEAWEIYTFELFIERKIYPSASLEKSTEPT